MAQPSDDRHNNAPVTLSGRAGESQPQQPAAAATVPMGYPPVLGYPPPPYQQPYPPNGYAPNPAYYTNQPYYPAPVAGRSGSSFMRGFVSMILAILVLTFVSSIVTWLLLRPKIPVFRVDSLAVAGLDLSRPDFSAQWAVNVTVENPNHKLRIYFEQVQCYVYYKEDFLSSSGVDPIFLPTRGREAVSVALRANNTEQHSVARWVVEEMGRERSAGAVGFNVRMLVMATFKAGSWWTRHASMKVLCEDLRVPFNGAEIGGVFVNGGNKPKRCNVYYG